MVYLPSAYEPKRDSLNPLILQLAGSMARKETGDLHIVHVWYLFGEHYVRSRGMTEKDTRSCCGWRLRQGNAC